MSMSRPIAEILAVVLTAAVFQVFDNWLDMKLPYLIACTLLWGIYLLRRSREAPEEIDAWGLGKKGLGPAARAAGALLVVGVIAITSWRIVFGWQPLPLSAIGIFALYPVWALIQQFVLQGLLVRNLETLGWPTVAIIPVSAVGFGLAHLPDWPLMGICAGVGVLWTLIWLRTRNLWPLALCHAWLGALTYYWVLERDPWSEMVPV